MQLSIFVNNLYDYQLNWNTQSPMTIINLRTSADNNPGTACLIIILTLFSIEDILPYKIGLCVTSAVAFCALVFGMIMYARRKNILKKVKQPCCKGKGQEGS